MQDFKIGDFYEDKRTHRSGKILEYNDKYKTYLFESADGATFNVTSSQLKVSWRQIEPEEVQEVILPVAEPAEVKAKSTYKGTTEAEKKELHDLFTNSALYINDYVQSFDNSVVSMKIVKPESKHTVRIKIESVVVADVQIMVGKRQFRFWLDEQDFNKASWTVEPLSLKKYPCTRHSYTVEFKLENLAQALEDLRSIVIDKLAEIKGGLDDAF